jgi:hypothetical protein
MGRPRADEYIQAGGGAELEIDDSGPPADLVSTPLAYNRRADRLHGLIRMISRHSAPRGQSMPECPAEQAASDFAEQQASGRAPSHPQIPAYVLRKNNREVLFPPLPRFPQNRTFYCSEQWTKSVMDLHTA